ncbi:ubiquitin carboxyl-terminal hydrolase 14-like [Lineus longissimus]|uniref:ubiquitin carboxyl-terminal hydrolase 14-like n=1 Tax=Lineus longissimus TaxID=88925 RepID=UPI002B4CBF2E
MPTFKVNVRWGKEKYESVECNTDEPPILFKAQLFALSGVMPERQKVMIKGITLKDDDNWGTFKIKNGATLMMMGTAEENALKEPVEKTVFLEDMSDSQRAAAMELPAGLTNLGNTCYMNATLQCFRAVPELKEALKNYQGSMSLLGGMDEQMDPQKQITVGMRDVFDMMDKRSEPIPPFIFLRILHTAFPQFAEKTDQGGYAQQDANECWTQMMRCLQQKLPTENVGDTALVASASGGTSGFIDKYFGLELETTMKCVESEEEEPTHSKEIQFQLSCFIEQNVKYMHTGLKSRLQEHITKHSPSLGKDAAYLKSSLISRLPSYLTIQFVRFYYKEKEAINAKILKDVKFPMMLDMYDLCTEDLKKKLVPVRNIMKEEEDKKLEKVREAKDKGLTEKEKKTRKEPFAFADDPGSNNSGYYELTAVLTHKGRSSSAGHYVGWVKKKGDEWLKFDDDVVSPVSAEEILKLSGGGDWHCAYVLLYAPRVLEIEEEDAPMETS